MLTTMDDKCYGYWCNSKTTTTFTTAAKRLEKKKESLILQVHVRLTNAQQL